MKYIILALLLPFTALQVLAQNADDRRGAVYFGVGSANTDSEFESDDTPLTLGYLSLSDSDSFVWGLDISREGTTLNSTSRKNNEIEQGSSFNLLLGTNLLQSDNFRTDLSVILGGRKSAEKCPDSFLGYECYADESPDPSYKFNYGAALTFNYKSLLIGIRKTGESTQGIIGYRF